MLSSRQDGRRVCKFTPHRIEDDVKRQEQSETKRQRKKGRAIHSQPLRLRKAPAGYGFGEVGGVLVLGEDGLGLDAIHVAARGQEHGFDVAAVFCVVHGGEAFPHSTIGDLLGSAFENDGFVSAVGANRAEIVSDEILCFASVWARAEPEGVFPPDSPNQH